MATEWTAIQFRMRLRRAGRRRSRSDGSAAAVSGLVRVVVVMSPQSSAGMRPDALAHQQQGDGHGDGEEHEREHARGTGVEVLEAHRVDELRDRQGGVVRVAGLDHRAGADVDAGGELPRDEGLRVVLHRLHDAGDDGEHHDRRDGGPGDVAELRPGARAVQVGRLVLLLRHVQQRGHEDDHQVADAPQGEQHQRGLGPVRVVEPARARAGRPTTRISLTGPGGRVEQEDEGDGGRDRRGQVRDVEGGAEEPDPRLDLRDQQADAEAEHHAQRDHHHDQPQRVPQGRAEQRHLLQHVPPVPQPDEGGRLDLVVVHEREVDGRDQRIAEEDREADQPGREEPQGAQSLAVPLAPQGEVRGAGSVPRPADFAGVERESAMTRLLSFPTGGCRRRSARRVPSGPGAGPWSGPPRRTGRSPERGDVLTAVVRRRHGLAVRVLRDLDEGPEGRIGVQVG